MIRILLALVFAFSAAALPIAPLPPRIEPTFYPDVYPDAASDGSSTLVTWLSLSGAIPNSGVIYGRIPEKQSSAFVIGFGGIGPKVAWNGSNYLVAYGIPGSRGTSAFPDIVLRIVHPDGRLGAERRIETSPGGTASVGDVVWDGTHWRVSIAENAASIVTIDRELNVVERMALPEARFVTFTKIDERVFAVQTLHDDSAEVFALDEPATRFRAAGMTRLAGRLAFTKNGNHLDIATFDPASGFSARITRIENATLLDAHPLAGGAGIAYRSGTNVFEAFIGSAGNIAQSSLVVVSSEGATAAVTADEVFVAVPHELRAYPSGAVVSLVDTAWQGNALVVQTGDHATAFWRQTANGGIATFTRKIDANGVPFGDVVQLPFDMAFDHAAAFDRQRVMLVWSKDARVFAWDGQTVHELGAGSGVSIASSAHGTFIAWMGPDSDVFGTPFPQYVPGGFAILPSLSFSQMSPRVSALGSEFMIVWTAENVVSTIVSPSGTVRTSSVFSNEWQDAVHVGGTLAAWRSTLFAFAPTGHPFERFDPHWGDAWTPIAIHDLGAQRHHVTIDRNGALYTSIVTMQGAFITGITPLDLLGVYTNPSVVPVGNRTIVVHGEGRVEVDVVGAPVARRRAVRR